MYIEISTSSVATEKITSFHRWVTACTMAATYTVHTKCRESIHIHGTACPFSQSSPAILTWPKAGHLLIIPRQTFLPLYPDRGGDRDTEAHWLLIIPSAVQPLCRLTPPPIFIKSTAEYAFHDSHIIRPLCTCIVCHCALWPKSSSRCSSQLCIRGKCICRT